MLIKFYEATRAKDKISEKIIKAMLRQGLGKQRLDYFFFFLKFFLFRFALRIRCEFKEQEWSHGAAFVRFALKRKFLQKSDIARRRFSRNGQSRKFQTKK